MSFDARQRHEFGQERPTWDLLGPGDEHMTFPDHVEPVPPGGIDLVGALQRVLDDHPLPPATEPPPF